MNDHGSHAELRIAANPFDESPLDELQARCGLILNHSRFNGREVLS